MIYCEIKGNSMLPNYINGQTYKFDLFDCNLDICKGDVVIFNHPFKKNLILIKRINGIIQGKKIIVTSDNPDSLHYQDSCNFGPILKKNIIGIKKENINDES